MQIDPTRPTAEANSDRLTYAGFPPALKVAMKAAAGRYGWNREDWRLQTTLIHDAILEGRASAHDLSPYYAQAPGETTWAE